MDLATQIIQASQATVYPLINKDWFQDRVQGTGLPLVDYQEQVWDNHHDIVVFQRRMDSRTSCGRGLVDGTAVKRDACQQVFV